MEIEMLKLKTNYLYKDDDKIRYDVTILNDRILCTDQDFL